MIKFHEIKVGDYMIADNDGDMKRGEVTNLNGDENRYALIPARNSGMNSTSYNHCRSMKKS